MGVGEQTALHHTLSQDIVLFPTPGGWVAENELYVSI